MKIKNILFLATALCCLGISSAHAWVTPVLGAEGIAMGGYVGHPAYVIGLPADGCGYVAGRPLCVSSPCVHPLCHQELRPTVQMWTVRRYR